LISIVVFKIVVSCSEVGCEQSGIEGCLIGAERAEGAERRVNKLNLVHSICCHTYLIDGEQGQEQSEDARQSERDGWIVVPMEVRCQREHKRWNG
jgi:hypothetical protein